MIAPLRRRTIAPVRRRTMAAVAAPLLVLSMLGGGALGGIVPGDGDLGRAAWGTNPPHEEGRAGAHGATAVVHPHLDATPPAALAPTTTAPTRVGALVAVVKPEIRRPELATAPGGPRLDTEWTLTNPTYFGGPLTLLVVAGEPHDAWVQVQVPVRPNGTTGWIRTSDVTFTEVTTRIEIDLAARRLRAFDRDTVLADVATAIGRDATPTPLGSFFVNERIKTANAAGPYGPWILSLSAFSETLDSFDGGIPVIAIHGTNQPWSVGQVASNGCLRLANDDIRLLAEVLPVGTPVVVR